MAFTVADTVRECTRRALAATDQPLTSTVIAEQINSTPAQVAKALRRLEAEGAAMREPGSRYQGGRTPNRWSAAP